MGVHFVLAADAGDVADERNHFQLLRDDVIFVLFRFAIPVSDRRVFESADGDDLRGVDAEALEGVDDFFAALEDDHIAEPLHGATDQ